ncbi:MAG: hypothetical protein ACKOPQ_08510 [Novosphingobium sp.]
MTRRYAAPFRLTLAAVLAFGLAQPALAAAPTQDAFVSAMIERVGKALPGRTVSSDPVDRLKLIVAKRGDDEEQSIFLDRVWRYCQQASAGECRDMQAEFIANMAAPRPKPTARSLRFIVRDAAYVESIRAMGAQGARKGEQTIYTRPIGDDLYMVLASDSKETVAIVNTAMLKEIGLSEADAWLIAVPQTRSILPKLADASALTKQWHAYQGQAYLGSIMGLTDDWSELSAQMGPDLFATAVSDQFFVAGKVESGEPLAKLLRGAENDCKAAQRCISPHVYRFREGRWVVAQ